MKIWAIFWVILGFFWDALDMDTFDIFSKLFQLSELLDQSIFSLVSVYVFVNLYKEITTTYLCNHLIDFKNRVLG